MFNTLILKPNRINNVTTTTEVFNHIFGAFKQHLKNITRHKVILRTALTKLFYNSNPLSFIIPYKCLYKKAMLLLMCVISACIVHAQNKLDVIISLKADRQPLKTVLRSMSEQANFYFSYNSNIINEDSLVSLTANNKTVKEILDMLFKSAYQYKETGNYIIIQQNSSGNYYTISGYVVDNKTGEKISDASVYEKQQLASTFTNSDGFFRLKLKDKYPVFSISISKIAYADTSVIIQPYNNQQVDVSITPVPPELMPVMVSSKVERTWLGKIFISSKQRMQSLNLRKFFASKEYQVSLVPGLGSHGLNAQAVNKVSLNIIGGYAAGTNGVEMAGLFNIDKKNVQHVQLAGLFNIVGGQLKGVQLAGLHNNVFDSLKGFQAAGFSNLVKGTLKGVQLSGSYNVIWGNLKGVQAAGNINLVKDKASGVQLAAIANISRKEMKGVQMAAIVNYAGYSRGLQIGLINISDTSNGYSIGLINIVKKGYHKLSLYSNEILNINLAYKSGNRKLYSILLSGINVGNNNRAYTFGYGIGSEFILKNQWSLTTELTSQNLYLGDWKSFPSLYRFQPSFNLSLGKKISLFAGPSFSIFHSKQTYTVPGYKSGLVSGYGGFEISKNTRGWFGFNAGINFF